MIYKIFMTNPYQQSFRLGPKSTPKIISWIVFVTIGLSLAWLIIETLFPHFAFTYLQHILGITAYGFTHGFIWQYFFYFFVQKSLSGLTLSFLIYFAIRMYVLWLIGSSLVQAKGKIQFLFLYFLGGALGGVAAGAVVTLSYSPFAYMNSMGAIYALLIAWMMLNPGAKLYLFFQLPLKTTWLILWVFGINLLLTISAKDYTSFFNYLTSGVVGYLYATFIWKCHGPFRALHSFEKRVMKSGKRFRRKKDDNIYDIKTKKKKKKD